MRAIVAISQNEYSKAIDVARYIVNSGAYDRGVKIVQLRRLVVRPLNYFERLSRQDPFTFPLRKWPNRMSTPSAIVFYDEEDIIFAKLKWNARWRDD